MKKIEKMMNNFVSHYNDQKFWKMKFKLFDKKIPKVIKFYYLFKLKRMEAFNGASLGNRVCGGSKFLSKAFFPHGIKGIFITDKATIGNNVTIFQQVTIGLKNLEDSKGPTIGNNVIIGAGAKIIGSIRIGDNVKIGANCVVFSDVPDNATVVLEKPRIIIKK